MKEGWIVNTLDEVCFFENGDRGVNYPSKKHYIPEGIPFITAANVQNGNILNNLNYISEARFKLLSRGKFKKGDFLFCLRGSLGKFGFVKKDILGGIGSSMVIVRAQAIRNKWLFYYFRSNRCKQEIDNFKGGAAQPNLGAKDLKKFEINVPPLNEQDTIVKILDKSFAKIDQAKANIEKNIENAKELFQSKLNEVFSQGGEGWEERSLEEITTKIGSGSTPRGGQSSYKASGISLIRSMNVHDDGFRDKNLAFIDEEQALKLKNVKLEENDVLLNITGASVARCCVVENSYLPARVNQHVSIIRLEKGIMNFRFLHYALTSKETKNLLLGIGEQGATRQAITKAQIQSFKISYPNSISFQNELVEILDNFKVKCAIIESHYHQKIKDLDELKKSLLQKAFSGELV